MRKPLIFWSFHGLQWHVAWNGLISILKLKIIFCNKFTWSPWGPVFPLGPEGPGGPWSPGIPWSPCGPEPPVSPLAPSAPLLPGAPWSPGVPSSPERNFFFVSKWNYVRKRSLIHLLPMHPFSTPWKSQNTLRFFDVFRG